MFITMEDFHAYPEDCIFAQGITTNDESGAFMTNDHKGRELRYVAKKGFADDWCIYVLWADEADFKKVAELGDKVTGKDNIMHIIPCEDYVYNRYRH